MTDVKKTKGQVRIFACGGAGTNIGKNLEQYRNSSNQGFADLDIVYVDTSASNFTPNIPENKIYLVKNLDGSGGLRRENAASITRYAQEILQEHPPLDLNIVISSGGGGSGSVAAPTLVSELLKAKQNVAVVLIGAVDTKQWINNTLNTLKSYEAISKKYNTPILMRYLQNETNSKREVVDAQINYLVIALAALFSKENSGLDSKDLEHWINFNKVTSYEPQLASLEVVQSLPELAAGGNIISVTTLVASKGNSDLGQAVEVQYVGYVPQGTEDALDSGLPLHFVTTDGLFEDLGTQLNKSLADLNAQASARVKRVSILTDEDETTDNGLVL